MLQISKCILKNNLKHLMEQEDNKEQDRYLPIANIGRIMKSALPKDAKIAKEARETV
jgi:histone H3/H4